MITIKLRDISKLASYIRIPSMAEGAETNDTVAQRILYSGLPNQCPGDSAITPEFVTSTEINHGRERHHPTTPLSQAEQKERC
jgi:hypothetical protein